MHRSQRHCQLRVAHSRLETNDDAVVLLCFCALKIVREIKSQPSHQPRGSKCHSNRSVGLSLHPVFRTCCTGIKFYKSGDTTRFTDAFGEHEDHAGMLQAV